MKTYSRPEHRRVVPIRPGLGANLIGGAPSSLRNECRDFPLRQHSLVWRARSAGNEWRRRETDVPLRGGWWGVKGTLQPGSSLATRGRERRLSAIHLCTAPGCMGRGVRPCFDCGEWRCEEHLQAAVHHRKASIVHLCPSCLQAHMDAPERLRIDGFEVERAQRAADPLAPREGPRDQITPLENNRLASRQDPAQTPHGWRLEHEMAPRTTKRMADRLMTGREL